MTDVELIPDIEQLVGAHLRGHAGVRAITDRVASRNPSTTTEPWVKLVLIDAGRISGKVEYAYSALLQFDCYGSSSLEEMTPEAILLGRTVRAAMAELAGNGDLDGVTVTEVEFPSHGRLPDVRFEPARERIVLDAVVYFHG